MPRMNGQGTIEPHRGRWRARLPRCYGRRSLGVYDTREEARAILDAALADLAADPVDVSTTLAAWGDRWLAEHRPQLVKARTIARDVTRWEGRIAPTPLGRRPLTEVSERDVRRWLHAMRKADGSLPSPTTLSNALSLVRGALEWAREEGRIASNPARDVKLPRAVRKKAASVRDFEWLRPEEIAAVTDCDAIPLRSRLIFAVAIYSGLRAGELWGLRWSDVDFERRVIEVRRSFEDAPKTHQVRDVQMLAPVYDALTAWRAEFIRRRTRSRHDLVWPSRSEAWHSDGYDAGWVDKWRRKAGVRRGVRFHDLRHTCASHLLQGTWAPSLLERPLRLEEVRDWLGHEDIATTQRYAHLCADRIRSLVVVPAGPQLTHTLQPPPGIEPRTYGLRNRGEGGSRGADRAETASVGRSVGRLAVEVLKAVRDGEPWALHRAVELAQAVMAAEDMGAENRRAEG